MRSHALNRSVMHEDSMLTDTAITDNQPHTTHTNSHIHLINTALEQAGMNLTDDLDRKNNMPCLVGLKRKSK